MIFITHYKKIIMSNTIDVLKKCFKQERCLERDNKEWRLTENGVTIKFKAPNRESFGFSLDYEDRFSFFSGTPPKNITKMCDGIIALTHKTQTYIFLIEQKTNYSNNYKKQIINAWHFCNWLLGLLKEHKHCDDNIKFIGLLYRNRRNVSKGISTHSKQKPKSKSILQEQGISFFETNNSMTMLQNYLPKKSGK